MHFNQLLRVAAVSAALLGCSAAFGQVIYDNGAPNGANGNEMTQWIQAENFTLGSNQTVAGVRFWNFEYGEGFTGSIWWGIYGNNGTTPTALLHSGLATSVGRTALPDVLGYDAFENLFSIAPVALAAGDYSLGLHNGDLNVDNRNNFYWEWTTQQIGSFGQEDNTPFEGGWYSNGAEHAFQLIGGAVPEPSTYGLIGAAMLALVIARRKLGFLRR